MSNKMPKNNHEEIESAPRSRVSLKIGMSLILFILFVSISLFLRMKYRQIPANDGDKCDINSNLDSKRIRGGDIEIVVEIAEFELDQTKGLSDRNCLGGEAGMLFVYDRADDQRCFWMKDMNFVIDMIWLDSDKKIINIESNVSPDSYPGSFCPDRPAQYVLEVDAGFTDRSGWQIDTKFEF